MAPASSTCAGFRPNITHFPRRDRRSESQREGRANGVSCRREVVVKFRLLNGDSLQLDRKDMGGAITISRCLRLLNYIHARTRASGS